ncbi:MAG TPA: NlpC/P60 family protein [Smithellaceae bacterium]|nr:LysM peptidoglycan-binding domain-containing protein [Smithella sp.]HNZ11660.1 NlpC/P60 family protein [Smithellaceae bacterium]HQP24297.1 NlpC/P60 family protein [Smithellaceae bacterium]HRY34365.1 NlpC/P60 family protein [Smithellaceae bacterium]
MRKRRILVLSGLFVLFMCCYQPVAHATQYTVKKGDTLIEISKKIGVSVQTIKKVNNLSGHKLKPGQVLSLKKKNSASHVSVKSKSTSASHYKVRKGDTLSSISKKTGIPEQQLATLNNIKSKKLRAGSSLILSKPKISAPAAAAPASAPPHADENDILLDEEGDDFLTAESSDNFDYEAETRNEFLGKWGSADERKLFVKVATGFLGAPYRMGGVTVQGIDCSAFVRKMYEFFNIKLPRTAREQAMVGVRVDRDKLEAGDLVFFRTKRPIGHVGIYIGNNEFVHASYRARSVRIDSLEKPYFQQRFQRAVRVKDFTKKSGT